jgi:FlaA1/EpsC-like NDP-sugar epimerase
MRPTLVRLYALPRRAKQLVLVVGDSLCLLILFWVALALRYDTLSPPAIPGAPFNFLVPVVVGVVALNLSGVYRAVVRAFDERFLQSLLLSVVAIVVVLFSFASTRMLAIPRSVPFIYGFFTFLWVWASRSVIRRLVRFLVRINAPVSRVAIYGAGVAGRQALSALRTSWEYLPVAFFDDAVELVGTNVQGLRVYSGADFGRLESVLGLHEVLVAMPSASRARRREVIGQLELHKLRVRTIPSFDQLVGGQVSISDIREVDIADLLGRDPVPPHQDLFAKDIAGKRVMVTGAGGSIGSELCRQVVAVQPELLLLCDVSEFALYSIDRELRALAPHTAIVPVLGSVMHEVRMTRLMADYAIDTVYHAAAYKHVPLVEHNPFEGMINNTIGTQRAARAAMAANVSTFVLISTDKAVRPTNVMGASKRLAEMVLQAYAATAKTNTRFCMVRFGNVLGSSGSVVPLFRSQIARGGPVTVTHPEMTRYFMTIPEAAQLVIQAGAMGEGGDVFVLDMGEAIKIVELARSMIRLSGMSTKTGPSDLEGDIEIVFTGLRPGEKLYEELLIGDNATTTKHPRIMRAKEKHPPLEQLDIFIEEIKEMARNYEVARLKSRLAEIVEGYPAPRMPTAQLPVPYSGAMPPSKGDAPSLGRPFVSATTGEAEPQVALGSVQTRALS